MGHFYLFKKKGTDVTNLNLIEKWKFGGIYLFYSILFYGLYILILIFAFVFQENKLVPERKSKVKQKQRGSLGIREELRHKIVSQ